MTSRTIRLVFSVSLLCLIGCTGSASIRDAISQGFDSYEPNSHGYSEGSADLDEGWVRDAGIEARGHRPVEKENDPFKVLMSPKAKSIEKNLGIE